MVRVAFNADLIKKVNSTSKNLRIKGETIPEKIDKLCNRALDLKKNLFETSQNVKIYTFRDLLNQLHYWEKKATKKEKVMFLIFKELINNRTTVLKSILKRLSWNKPCRIQEAQNLIKNLEKQGLVLRVNNCPNCKSPFNYLSDNCEKCGYELIIQEVDMQDKRLRPRYAIMITEKGITFVKELMTEYHQIHHFFITWYKQESLNFTF
ncbi:MAG: hypothetical protein ACFFE4_01555 [Candidatus Thorarchaeota archaeon]